MRWICWKVLAVLVGTGTAYADEPPLKLHKLEVAFMAPDPSYSVRIVEVRRVGKELWVRSEVRRADGFAPQVLKKIDAQLTIRLPDLPVKHLVTGKTWKWPNEEPYLFADDMPEAESKKLLETFKAGEVWLKTAGE